MAAAKPPLRRSSRIAADDKAAAAKQAEKETEEAEEKLAAANRNIKGARYKAQREAWLRMKLENKRLDGVLDDIADAVNNRHRLQWRFANFSPFRKGWRNLVSQWDYRLQATIDGSFAVKDPVVTVSVIRTSDEKPVILNRQVRLVEDDRFPYVYACIRDHPDIPGDLAFYPYIQPGTYYGANYRAPV